VLKCGYCGCGNDDAATHCAECGTGFSLPPADAPPVAPRDRTWLEWLKYLLSCIGFVLLFGLIYLLSFGPVAAYCCKMTSRTTTTTVNGSNSVTTVVRTMSLPRWVVVVYRPAMMLRGGGGPGELYNRYLAWWTARRQKP
jgi:hypothetical protein